MLPVRHDRDLRELDNKKIGDTERDRERQVAAFGHLLTIDSIAVFVLASVSIRGRNVTARGIYLLARS